MRISKRTRWAVLIVALFHFLSACSVNVLDGTAGKTTDEAYYEDALKQIDQQQYESALENFDKLSASFASKTDVLEAWAGAYAGHCGLDFAAYMNQMSTTDFGVSSFFATLANVWGNKVVVPASCKSAEQKIKTIWETETPTSSQQLFMVVLSMVKIGTYIRSKADVAENGGLGDGTVDATFNACTNNAANMTDDEIKEVVSGFSLFVQNVAGFAATLAPSLDMNDINDACALASENICGTADAENVTAPMVAAMRDIFAIVPPIGLVDLANGGCVPIPGVVEVDDCCP